MKGLSLSFEWSVPGVEEENSAVSKTRKFTRKHLQVCSSSIEIEMKSKKQKTLTVIKVCYEPSSPDHQLHHRWQNDDVQHDPVFETLRPEAVK